MSREKKSEMPFLDHLEELRWRIIKTLVSVIVGAIITFFYMDSIFQILLHPATALENPPNLQVLTVYGMFMIKWGIAIVGGIIIGLPVITYQIWKFVVPGLLINEKRYAAPTIIFTFIAFLCGICFAYFIVIPFSLKFFTSIGYTEVANNFSINYYFNYILWILLGVGLVFELPVLVMVLSTIGLVTPPFMRHYRKHSIIVILLLSAFITPPDPVSLLIMSVPLIFLYEISIGISKIFMRKF